jgi:creatinine amidohydrolase/Fe(II)-dependent formamide hydrolase-like protein
MALETAKRSTGLVLPVLNIGYAWVWRGIPGTLTFRFDTYMSVIRDIAESLDAWGIKALFVISGHGSNPQPVKHAIRELIHDNMSWLTSARRRRSSTTPDTIRGPISSSFAWTGSASSGTSDEEAVAWEMLGITCAVGIPRKPVI